MTSVEVADGAKETPLNAARVCLLTLCWGRGAGPRAQRGRAGWGWGWGA